MAVNIKELLTRKVGPLPVWGWAVAGGAAYFIVRGLRSTDPSDTSGIDPEGMEDVDYYGGDGFEDGGGVTTVPGGQPIINITNVLPGPREAGGRRYLIPKAGQGRHGHKVCPPGWHRASKGALAGFCVPNVGGQRSDRPEPAPEPEPQPVDTTAPSATPATGGQSAQNIPNPARTRTVTKRAPVRRAGR